MNTKSKWIIVDEFDNICFSKHKFDDYEDAWRFLYVKYPVIYNPDGTQDDRDDELNSYFVIEESKY